MTPARRAAILGKQTSRRNKMALLADLRGRGFHIVWRWAGVPYNSRLWVAFGTELHWHECQSFDEDVLPTYKSGKEKK